METINTTESSMEDLLKQYVAEVDNCDVLKNEYTMSQKRRDRLFNIITSKMKCTRHLLMILKISDKLKFKTDNSIDDLLVAASSIGNIEMVRLCIAHNANDPAYKALAYASRNGHFDIVDVLTKKFKYPSLEMETFALHRQQQQRDDHESLSDG